MTQPPVVTSVSIAGVNAINVGAQSNMTASARRSDGSSENVTTSATWQSSNIAVATVSSTGVVRGVAPGTSVITATFSGQTGQIDLQVAAVDNVQVVRVEIASVVVGGTCDNNSIFEDAVDGEFSLHFEVIRDGGRTTIYQTSRQPLTRSTHRPVRSLTFNRNVTRGEDFVLEFEASEYDGLLGNDSRMNGRFSRRSYVYTGGQWTPAARSITLGSGSCEVTLNYTITSTQQ